MTKYQPLSDHLAHLKGAEWRPTFHELERMLGFNLPGAARAKQAWWRNTGKGHAASWAAADWEVDGVDLEHQRVAFRRRVERELEAPERDEAPRIPVRVLAVAGGVLLALGAGAAAVMARGALKSRRAPRHLFRRPIQGRSPSWLRR